MTRQRARTTSQTLAASVTLAAVLIMLSPLLRGSVDGTSRQAGWTPLLDLGGMADTAAFRRLDTSSRRFAASPQPLCRQPSANPAP